MESYEGLNIQYGISAIASILVVLIVLSTLAICYYVKVKKIQANQTPTKFVLLMCMFIDFIKGIVSDVIGKKFVKLTPFFLFIFMSIAMSNLTGLLGFKEPTTSSAVPLSFALIVWVSTQVVAIKYQRTAYLTKMCFKIKIKGKKYPVMVNPLEILSKFTPIISLTFRLWGNITAGSIIYAIIWWALGSLPNSASIAAVIIGGLVLFPFLMSYFTLFSGVIQAFVFTILSVVYWGNEIKDGLEIYEAKKQQKQENILAQQQALLAHKNTLQKNQKENINQK